MLNLMRMTPTHSSHVETDDFDHNTFQKCWNVLVIFTFTHCELTFLTTAHVSPAETYISNQFTFQTCQKIIPLRHMQALLNYDRLGVVSSSILKFATSPLHPVATGLRITVFSSFNIKFSFRKLAFLLQTFFYLVSRVYWNLRRCWFFLAFDLSATLTPKA
jgi:hypothetical protein